MQMCFHSYEYIIITFSWYNSLFHFKHWENQSVVDLDRCLASLVMNIDLK